MQERLLKLEAKIGSLERQSANLKSNAEQQRRQKPTPEEVFQQHQSSWKTFVSSHFRNDPLNYLDLEKTFLKNAGKHLDQEYVFCTLLLTID